MHPSDLTFINEKKCWEFFVVHHSHILFCVTIHNPHIDVCICIYVYVYTYVLLGLIKQPTK